MGKTIGLYGEAEIAIQKSRFLCQAKRVETEIEAVAFIAEVGKKYWNATHNCYAYVVTDTIQKSSDDGEPAGTAGRPILEVIHTKELLHTAIIITRYYGGIKLGTGGLVRAYSHGAIAAIEAAGIVARKLHQQLLLNFDYHHFGRLEYELRATPYLLDTAHYEKKITWPIWVPVGEVTELLKRLADQTGGQVKVELGKKEVREI
jgi:uncharacterized YigZ family protein